jgi:acyl-CoA thioester hydrolase
MMTAVFTHELLVPDDVLDENGHVNNVVYIQWMQDVAVLHSDGTGCTEATKNAGATWVVRSHKIEYLLPAFSGDLISVSTWVANFRRVRSLRRYKFIRKSDSAVLARGETDWVFLNSETGRLVTIPESVRELLPLVTEDQEPL